MEREDVAGMRVGVEEPGTQHLVERRPEQFLRKRGAVDTGGVDLADLRDGVAVEPLLHEDATGAQPYEHRRDANGRTLAEEQRHLVHGVGLAQKVELRSQARGELREHLTRSHTLAERGAPLRDLGEQREGSEVAFHHLGDSGALHLDHHRLAGVQPRGVRLPDGSRGERLPIELGENVVDAAIELGLERGPDDLHRLRRNPILQVGKLVDDVGRNQIDPSGRDLPELDVYATGLLEHAPKPDPDCFVRMFGPVRRRQERSEPLSTRQAQELAVAAQHCDALRHRAHGSRCRHQAGTLADCE